MFFVKGDTSHGPLVIELADTFFASPDPSHRNTTSERCNLADRCVSNDTDCLDSKSSLWRIGFDKNYVSDSHLAENCMCWRSLLLVPTETGYSAYDKLFCDIIEEVSNGPETLVSVAAFFSECQPGNLYFSNGSFLRDTYTITRLGG